MEKLGLPKLSLWQITVLVLSLAGLWALWMLRAPLQHKRLKLSGAEKVWAQLEAWLKTQNIDRHRSETPQDFINRACTELKHHENELRHISGLLMPARFAALTDSMSINQAKQAHRDLEVLKRKRNKDRS